MGRVRENAEMLYTDFFDDVRATATILVVVGHATILPIREDNAFVNYMWIILYLFHMATFFIISGYLYQYKREKYKQMGKWRFIVRKFIYLMIPYYSYSVITYIIVWIGLRIPVVQDIFKKSGFIQYDFKTIMYQILTHEGSLDVHVWFVLNLFIIFVTVTLLYPFLSRKYSTVVGLTLYIIITCIVELPECLRSSFAELIYFLIGMKLAMYSSDNIKRVKHEIIRYLPVLIPITCGAVYVCVLNQSGLLVFNQISLCGKLLNKMCHYISGVILGLGFINLIQQFSKKYRSQLLRFIHNYSYDIYLLHQPFIVTGISFLVLKVTGSGLFAVIIATIVGILITILISKYILRRNRVLSLLFLGKIRD